MDNDSHEYQDLLVQQKDFMQKNAWDYRSPLITVNFPCANDNIAFFSIGAFEQSYFERGVQKGPL